MLAFHKNTFLSEPCSTKNHSNSLLNLLSSTYIVGSLNLQAAMMNELEKIVSNCCIMVPSWKFCRHVADMSQCLVDVAKFDKYHNLHEHSFHSNLHV